MVFSRDHFRLPAAASREAWFVATFRAAETARQRDVAVLCWDSDVIERLLHDQRKLVAMLCLYPLGSEWPQWRALEVRAVWRQCRGGRGLVVEDGQGCCFEVVPGGLESVGNARGQGLTLLASLGEPGSGNAPHPQTQVGDPAASWSPC